MPSRGERRAERQRRRAVHRRGRFGRFAGGFVDYVETAWWGLVSPRVPSGRPLRLAQAAVFREGEGGLEILLSMRSDLFGWELPGGTIEHDEDAGEAAIREVREETGLEIEIEQAVGSWTRTGFRPHQVTIFRCRARGGELQTSHETPRVGWFPIGALPEGVFPWYDEPIATALRMSEEFVSISEYQGIRAIWQAMKIDLRTRWNGLP